jgi:tetratricopeptide (TPR) repeat protein
MKRLSIAVFALMSALSLLVFAEGPDDVYVRIYSLILQGDQLNATGQSDKARDKYLEAETGLKKLRAGYPNWNEGVVDFRLKYVTEKLAGQKPQTPAASAPAKAAGQPESIQPKPRQPAVPMPDTSELQAQLRAMNSEVQHLKADKAVLEAKLKEALSAQPAAIDPRELVKAEDRIRSLEKEKEVLKAALDREQAKPPQINNNVEEIKKALAEANDKLKQQTDAVVALSREKQILETRLQSSRKAEESLNSLRAENEALKKDLSVARTSVAPVQPAKPQPSSPAPATEELQKELAAARTSAQTNASAVADLRSALTALQAEKERLQQSSAELEKKLATAASLPAKPAAGQSEEVKRIAKERDELQRKLNETNKQLYDNKSRTESVQKKQRDEELTILRARLEVFESRKVPYTPEELALFKQPPVGVTKPDPKTAKKASREFPRGAEPLLAQAERAFAQRRFEEAEQAYLKVLERDDKNVFTLANLAAIQLEQKRFDAAEETLKKAIAQDANDSHTLQLIGILKFEQEKYDEALDFLSRCVHADPQNAQAQNYLGITLSQKGQRGPAEAALRKAIQIEPGYAGAHHNLAVVYATQQPPFTELARWHYQKALSTGYPQNPDLEKLIEQGRASTETK